MVVRSRRGRPRLGEEDQRRDEALDAAFLELIHRGYESTTMLGVARRASASKESLYSWFGSKEGLFAAVIRREADATNAKVAEVLDSDIEPRKALLMLAASLLRLLTGERSVAINRVAMTSPGLATVLLEHGRHRTGPLVESYLQRLVDQGYLDVDDVGNTFQLLYGLVVQDFQIRTLLGEPPPSPPTIQRVAEQAIDRFLALTKQRSN